MKKVNATTFLSLVVLAILATCLIPNINKANNISYVRVWEDTNDHSLIENDSTKHKKRSKRFKKERIKPSDSNKSFKLSMFSRAIHFKEESQLVLDDSLFTESVATETAP